MQKRIAQVLSAMFAVAVLAAAGASISSANVAPRDPGVVGPVYEDDALHDEDGLAPVIGDNLFAGASAACLTRDAVSASLAGDAAALGGKTYLLRGGVQQAFADAWRHDAGGEPVAVTGIVAHLFGSGSDWTVDVVEIGADGCAFSRTLMPGELWSSLLKQAIAEVPAIAQS